METHERRKPWETEETKENKKRHYNIEFHTHTHTHTHITITITITTTTTTTATQDNTSKHMALVV